MSAYSVDEWKTCDVFNTIAKTHGDDAATDFMRKLNQTRLEREIEAEQVRQKQLIAKAGVNGGLVVRSVAWFRAQENVTLSFAKMKTLLDEYDEAFK